MLTVCFPSAALPFSWLSQAHIRHCPRCPGTVVPSSPHSFAPVVPLASCSSPSFHIIESHPSLSVLPSVLHFIDNAFPINLTYIRNTGMNSPGHKIEALQIDLTSTDKRQQALFLLESKGYYLCAADSSRVISMHLYTYIRTSRKLCFLCVWKTYAIMFCMFYTNGNFSAFLHWIVPTGDFSTWLKSDRMHSFYLPQYKYRIALLIDISSVSNYLRAK